MYICIYTDECIAINNKKKNTIPIVVVAVSRYVFAFLPPRHLPQSKGVPQRQRFVCGKNVLHFCGASQLLLLL